MHLRSLIFILLPAMALAQQYNSSPLLVTGAAPTNAPVPAPAVAAPAHAASNAAAFPATPPVPTNFPDWAVSNAAQNTAGNTNPAPRDPANPANPANPASGGASLSPTNPATPLAPASPITKLWPSDTVPIFVKSCIGFHVELAPACTCVITTLMATMPHDEFLRESENNTVENDPRLINARQQCIGTPGRK